MKILKCSVAIVLTYLFLFSASVPFAGCTKTVYDTVIQKDTIILKDTVKVHDTALCGDLLEGLVAYYTFTNGSLKDSSGNNNDIYVNTAIAAPDRFGKANNAYDFSSLSHIMRVRNSPSLNPQQITLMAVVKPRSFYSGTCHANEILGKGPRDNMQGFYYMRFQDVGARCVDGQQVDATREYFSSGFGDNIPLGNQASASSDTSFIKVNEWYTVIYTYDGFVSRLYVNGKLNDIRLKQVTFTPNTNDLVIGRHDDAQYPYPFNGVLDELRIYNKALCPEQIAGLNDLKH